MQRTQLAQARCTQRQVQVQRTQLAQARRCTQQQVQEQRRTLQERQTPRLAQEQRKTLQARYTPGQAAKMAGKSSAAAALGRRVLWPMVKFISFSSSLAPANFSARAMAIDCRSCLKAARSRRPLRCCAPPARSTFICRSQGVVSQGDAKTHRKWARLVEATLCCLLFVVCCCCCCFGRGFRCAMCMATKCNNDA